MPCSAFPSASGPRVDFVLNHDDWPEPGHVGTPTRPGSGHTLFLIAFPLAGVGGRGSGEPPDANQAENAGGAAGRNI